MSPAVPHLARQVSGALMNLLWMSFITLSLAANKSNLGIKVHTHAHKTSTPFHHCVFPPVTNTHSPPQTHIAQQADGCELAEAD